MEETYKTLKTKVQNLMNELKDLSENYKLKKFNIEIVLNNTSNNENITLKVDEQNNLVVNKTKGKEEPKLTETMSEGGSLKTISSDNTLSTSIFRTSVIDESENLKTEDFDLSHNSLNKNTRINSKDKIDNLRGGFIKSKQVLEKIDLSTSEQTMSSTSELRTTIKNIVGLQGGNNLMSETSDFKPTMKKEKISATSLSATSDYKVGGNNNNTYSATSLSATSDYKVAGNNNNTYSATSLSATSGHKVGGNNTYSATSLSATSEYKVEGNNNTYSATSLSATSDYKVGGGNNNTYSATSLSATSGHKVEGGNNNTYSATSLSATSGHKVEGGNIIYSASSDVNNKFSATKMDIIKQKIRELEFLSDKNVFSKNKSQSGGSRQPAINTDKFKQMKETIGINSSSTSSLCE